MLTYLNEDDKFALIEENGSWDFPKENECNRIEKEIAPECFFIQGKNAPSEWHWYTFSELLQINTDEKVQQNLAKILNSTIEHKYEYQLQLENYILSKGFRKKNDRVFYADSLPATIDHKTQILAKELAKSKGLEIFRFCLHQTDSEAIHEMIIIHTRPHQVAPHRQTNRTTVSYHALDGKAVVNLFESSEQISKTIYLDSSNKEGQWNCRLNARMYRSLESISPYFIFLEVSAGPFLDSDTQWLNL